MWSDGISQMRYDWMNSIMEKSPSNSAPETKVYLLIETLKPYL